MLHANGTDHDPAPRKRWLTALVSLLVLLAGCANDNRSAIVTPTSTTTTTTPAATTSLAPVTTLASTTTVGGTVTTSAVTTSAVTTRAAAPLFGVAIGADAEGAIVKLVAALGQPSADSSWDIGCPLDNPTLKNERLLSWAHLRVLFGRDTEAVPGTLRGYGFVLSEGGDLPAGDGASRLALPTGAKVGTPIGQVATTLGFRAQIDKVFGWVRITTPGVTFTADGDSLTAPLNGVSVPRLFTCE